VIKIPVIIYPIIGGILNFDKGILKNSDTKSIAIIAIVILIV
jgi:hypothetical protein